MKQHSHGQASGETAIVDYCLISGETAAIRECLTRPERLKCGGMGPDTVGGSFC